MTDFQPNLPEPTTPTEAESSFLEDQPYGILPANQDSNLGLFRRIFTDQLQQAIDQLSLMYAEKFVSTSVEFLDEHEKSVGLPPNPTNISLNQRRERVLARLRKGPFSRARRRALVEGYILATFGQPIQLTPAGVEFPLDGSGLQLFAESGALDNFIRIYEFIQNYSYLVKIASSVTPDLLGLTRELLRITPAGISFTIDTTDSSPLEYRAEIFDTEPRAFWRMQTLSDEMFNRSPMTNPGAGGGTVVAGLLTGDTNQARSFNGTTYQAIADTPDVHLATGELAFEAWVKPTTLPTVNGEVDVIYTGADNRIYLGVIHQGPGADRFFFSILLDGVQRYITGTIPVVANVAYHVVASYNGRRMQLFVNGVEDASSWSQFNFSDNSSYEADLSGWFFDGATFVRDNTVAGIPHGAWALKGTGATHTAPFGVETFKRGVEGGVYTAFGYFRRSIGGAVRIYNQFFDVDFNSLPGDFLDLVVSANVWTPHQISTTAPPGTYWTRPVYQWLDVAVGGGESIYLDNVILVGTDWGGEATDTTAAERRIANINVGGANFIGVIDEVAVYDKGFTVEMANRHYKTGKDLV